jgi:hypothetical protein
MSASMFQSRASLTPGQVKDPTMTSAASGQASVSTPTSKLPWIFGAGVLVYLLFFRKA